MTGHEHSYTYSRVDSERVLPIVFIMTAVMFAAELIGGLLSNSLALVGDSGHMLMDSIAIGASLLAFKISKRPATNRKTYGYYRLEILAALVNGVLLIFVSGYIFYEAYLRFTAPAEIKAPLMLVVAVAGLIVNVASIYLLWGTRKESLNVKGAFAHVFSDTISSLGVIVASIVIFFTDFTPVDSFIGAIIGVLILRSSFGVLRESLKVLLEYVPEGIDAEDVTSEIMKIGGVQGVHDLHIWSISSGINAISGHVIIQDQMLSKSGDILEQITKMLRERYSIVHTTLQLECKVCKGPFICQLTPEEKG